MEVGQVWRYLPEQRDMRIVEVKEMRLLSGMRVTGVVFEPVAGFGRDWWWRAETWSDHWALVAGRNDEQ